MKREDVESIAREYAQDKYCTDENPMPQYKIAQIHAGRDGFIDGCNFRVNSVWHDNNVTPGYDCHVLMEDIYGNIYDDRYDADYNEYDSGITKKEIKRWAYIKDLIPEMEE